MYNVHYLVFEFYILYYVWQFSITYIYIYIFISENCIHILNVIKGRPKMFDSFSLKIYIRIKLRL